MTKAPTPTEMSKGQSDNTKPQKSSITQWLRTDLGRSVGVTTATQLVLLTIGPKNTNLVEAVDILLPVKFRRILFIFSISQFYCKKKIYIG